MATAQSICLVKCPSPFLIDEKVFPPLGIMAVGTALQKMGRDVRVYDGPIDQIPEGYGYYGVGPVTPEYHYAVKILNNIKRQSPKATVIIGGPHATLTEDQCLADGFDRVVVGDIMEDLPIINRGLVDIHSYRYLINGIPATTVVTSRGCPYQCAFCCKTDDGVTIRTAEDIIAEVSYLHNDFGFNALMFFDDTFLLGLNRVLKISAHLGELNIKWRCFARADQIVKHGADLLKTMKKSGCVEIGMGVESGSDTILQNINKGETTNTIKQAVGLINEIGMRVKGFFIVGLPGESPKTVDETRAFLNSTQFSDVDFTVFQPYPGSHIYANKNEYDIDWSDLDWSKMHYKGRPEGYECAVCTSHMQSADILRARDDLESNYKRWEING